MQCMTASGLLLWAWDSWGGGRVARSKARTAGSKEARRQIHTLTTHPFHTTSCSKQSNR